MLQRYKFRLHKGGALGLKGLIKNHWRTVMTICQQGFVKRRTLLSSVFAQWNASTMY